MNEYTFKVDLDGICDLDCFKEASRDELKVLLAIKSEGERALTEEDIASLAGVSRARAVAAIALFEESGVIVKDSGVLATVEYEFGEDKKTKDSARDLARSIRDNDLYEMNMELERIFEKTLETREIARITSLYTKKGLSPEYILTLAAFLKDHRRTFSVELIVREATKLVEAGTDTLEELEVYIKEKSEEIAGEMEMRRLLGIYGRTLTKTEREHFNRWVNEFGYSTVIIGEAYDITVQATGKASLPYMNSILTGWHDAGCQTLEACRARVDSRKHENSKKANNNSQKTKKSIATETPKYADFNSEDALLRALERSYGESDDN